MKNKKIKNALMEILIFNKSDSQLIRENCVERAANLFISSLGTVINKALLSEEYLGEDYFEDWIKFLAEVENTIVKEKIKELASTQLVLKIDCVTLVKKYNLQKILELW